MSFPADFNELMIICIIAVESIISFVEDILAVLKIIWWKIIDVSISIVSEVNEAFDVDINVEDLLPENFNTAAAIYDLVTKLAEE